MLAPHPDTFASSGHFITLASDRSLEHEEYAMTNSGLKIQLPIIRAWRSDFAVLNACSGDMRMCDDGRRTIGKRIRGYRACVALGTKACGKRNHRSSFPPEVIHLPNYWSMAPTELYLGCAGQKVEQVSRAERIFGLKRYSLPVGGFLHHCSTICHLVR